MANSEETLIIMFLVRIPCPKYKPADLPRFTGNNLGRGELPMVKASQICRGLFFSPPDATTDYFHLRGAQSSMFVDLQCF